MRHGKAAQPHCNPSEPSPTLPALLLQPTQQVQPLGTSLASDKTTRCCRVTEMSSGRGSPTPWSNEGASASPVVGAQQGGASWVRGFKLWPIAAQCRHSLRREARLAGRQRVKPSDGASWLRCALPTGALDGGQAAVVCPGVKGPLGTPPCMRQLRVWHLVQLPPACARRGGRACGVRRLGGLRRAAAIKQLMRLAPHLSCQPTSAPVKVEAVHRHVLGGHASCVEALAHGLGQRALAAARHACNAHQVCWPACSARVAGKWA